MEGSGFHYDNTIAGRLKNTRRNTMFHGGCFLGAIMNISLIVDIYQRFSVMILVFYGKDPAPEEIFCTNCQ